MARYLLAKNAAPHYEKDPTWDQKTPEEQGNSDPMLKYLGGSVVESNRPLDTIFINKFVKVVPGMPGVPATKERQRATNALIASGHWEEADRDFLHSMEDKHFARMQKSANLAGPVEGVGKPSTEQATTSSTSTTQPPKKSAEKVKSNLGEDVTEEFPDSEDAGVLVFRNAAGKHQVATREVPNKALGKTALDRDHVSKFITDYMEE